MLGTLGSPYHRSHWEQPMITNNLACDFLDANPHEIVAAIGGVLSVEETIGDTAPIHFRSFADLPARTAEEEKALAWEPALIETEPNTTYETRIDDAIKAARDLYEAQDEPWPVIIWRWQSGSYGFGLSIPEKTEVLLFIDDSLKAFMDMRKDAR